MKTHLAKVVAGISCVALTIGGSTQAVAESASQSARSAESVAAGPQATAVVRAAVPPGRINHIVVIDLENEDYASSFGPDSPLAWLNEKIVPQGQVIENYFATSHLSMGNYISQISGQASTQAQNNDCLDMDTVVPPYDDLLGTFTDITPATPTADGQVIGDGCVFPASVKNIANQLDEKFAGTDTVPWKGYMEDMGNLPDRDGGKPDPMGGTTCAHPKIGSPDLTNSAVAGDGYATRHNPFVYFHSIIDDEELCNERVVPLGTVEVGKNGAPDKFSGHLAEDLKSAATTPAFAMVTPDLCNDGHDSHCEPADVGGTATDIEGGDASGMEAADIWLKHWIPMMMASPAYTSGEMLIVITFDEAEARKVSSEACCNQPSGPNQKGNPGWSDVMELLRQPKPTGPGEYPGGGKIGALLLNSKYITPGSRNTTGEYNHYSALRSYEDLLGLTTGGTDGLGHLGYAASPGLKPFGTDVFNAPTGLFAGQVPARVTDTRTDKARLTSGDVLTVGFKGTDARSLNLTAVNPSGAGYLTAYPCSVGDGGTSSVNFVAGQTTANLAVVSPDSAGNVCVKAFVLEEGTVDVVVDDSGMFAPDAGFTPIKPQRLVDSRTPGAIYFTDSVLTVKGLTPGAGALLNVTAARPTAAGHLTAYPCAQERPTASIVNYLPGGNRAAMTVATADADGTVCIYASGATDVVVDRVGEIEPTNAMLFTPTRLIDTRTAKDAEPATKFEVSVPEAYGRAVVLSVTGVNPSAAGHLSLYPCAAGKTDASTLNYWAGTTVANGAIITPDADGMVCVESLVPIHLVADASGYLEPVIAS